MEPKAEYSNVLFLRERSKFFLKNAKKETKRDLKKKIKSLAIHRNISSFVKTAKSIASTTSWLGHSYFRYYKSFIKLKSAEGLPTLTVEENIIIKKVITKDKSIIKLYGQEKVFKAIYKEALLSHSFLNVSSRLRLPYLQTVIVILDGIFNELFSQSAFERSIQKLSNDMGIIFFIPKISGINGSSINSKKIEKELHEFSKKNPSKKFWLLAYSKGGIDALHYLSRNKEFAEKKIKGLSTLATPILGSDKFNKGILKYLKQFQRKLDDYSFRRDIFFKDLQKSLDSKFQKTWFLQNYRKLPKNIFYSSLGFEAHWKEAHLWMLITKLIFQSPKKNDGVVNTDDAHFPCFFPSLKLGTISGHHLIGMRSTFQSQEAILEALLIHLNFLNLLD
jgi:hypothetical protein